MDNIRLIRKYRNRKLYDIEKSTYITQMELLQIYEKHPVKVIENLKETDITSYELANAIYNTFKDDPLCHAALLVCFMYFYKKELE